MRIRLFYGVLMATLLVAALNLWSRPIGSYLMATDAGRTISRAEMITQDGRQQIVTLPQQWQQPYRQIITRTFEINVELQDAPREEIYLYLPYFEQRLIIRIGDDVLYDSRVLGVWTPITRSTTLVLLPRANLHIGSNTVRFEVESGPAPLGSLSPVVVGSLGELRSVFLLRSFLTRTIPPVLFGMQFFLALAGLLLFALRPKDVSFGWLGILMMWASLAALGAMPTGIPQISVLAHWLFVLIAAAGFSLLGFSLSLTRLRVSRYIFIAMVVVIAGLLVLADGFGVPAPAISFSFSFPLFFLTILASIAILTQVSLRDPRLEVVLFLFSLILLLCGVAHDFAIRLGMIADGIFWTTFSRFVSVLAIAIFIVRRLVSQAEMLDRSAETLRQKLDEKEIQLQSSFEQQKKLDDARLLAEERSRITAELHDGVAGHLTTIVALSDQPDDVTNEIKQSARNALLDLRMVIDAMAVSGGSLRYYLGLFRNRCIEPLEAIGINVKWSMARLPEIDELPPEKALNIMRILQEAVNNALRHGEPETISITGEPEGPDAVKLIVSNAVSNTEQASDGQNLGLTNMRTRAHGMGGSLDFRLASGKSDLVLIFPIGVSGETAAISSS